MSSLGLATIAMGAILILGKGIDYIDGLFVKRQIHKFILAQETI